uniref:Uncharacterized protein n=1 Tax=mine drainage metagenome TaxID=410659 RepID=E6QHC5_9ZZZZ
MWGWNIERIAGECRKCLETKVNPNGVDWECDRSLDFALGDERYKPIPAGIAFEGGALGRHGHSLRKTEAYPSNLWTIDPLNGDFDSLWNTERIALFAFLFELWKAGSLLEEIREGAF